MLNSIMCTSCIPNFIQARKIEENMERFLSSPPSKLWHSLTTDFYETCIFNYILYGIIILNCSYRGVKQYWNCMKKLMYALMYNKTCTKLILPPTSPIWHGNLLYQIIQEILKLLVQMLFSLPRKVWLSLHRLSWYPLFPNCTMWRFPTRNFNLTA